MDRTRQTPAPGSQGRAFVAPGADGSEQVVSAEQLLEKVWDEHVNLFTNVVRVTIMTLRRKLGDFSIIETVTGVDYRMS